MKVVVIDNYDSFTFNLVHYVEDVLQQKVDVFRNDLEDISILEAYSHIILSPGPGIPSEAGKLLEIINKFSASKNILGICLGMQAIGVIFGAQMNQLLDPKHGVQELITQNGKSDFFKNLSASFLVGRYHSWCVSFNESNSLLTATAFDVDGNIMALKHKYFAVEAVQFHPESIMTPDGKKMLENYFLKP